LLISLALLPSPEPPPARGDAGSLAFEHVPTRVVFGEHSVMSVFS
jgi:hypothetical protein